MARGPAHTSVLTIVALAAAATVGAADFSDKHGFTVSAGGEYQYISQEFYRNVVDTMSTDIIETWRLDTDQIDEFILKAMAGYNNRSRSSHFSLSADAETSTERFLGRAESFYRLGDYDDNIGFSAKVESKAPYDKGNEQLEGYNFYEVSTKARRRLSRIVALEGKIGYERVSFTDAAVEDSVIQRRAAFPTYDYSVLSGQVGGEFFLTELGHELSWFAAYRNRHVPDSMVANYDQYQVGLEYRHSRVSTMLDLAGEVEVKDYARPVGMDDFFAITIRGHGAKEIGDKWETALVLGADIYRFDQPDLVNRDYWLLTGELEGSYRISGVEGGPLVRIEFRDEELLPVDTVEYYSEAFNQFEGGLQAGSTSLGELFFDVELTYGRRNYRGGMSLLTSYDFVAVSLMGNYTITRNFSLNMMLEGETERHERKEDDANLYLFSGGVTARF